MNEGLKDWLAGFDKRFAELTHGMVKDLEKCLQCGKCTAQCPAAKISSYNPRQIIRDLRMGNVEKVISSQELWLCFFCSGCYAVCPRDINFPFAIAMLRYAALGKGHGWNEVKKIKDPYAQDYYNTGLSVSHIESNIGVRESVAEHSGTDGSILAVRRKIGLGPRVVTQKALDEIRFISDATGMTDLFEKIPNMKDVPKSWNYGSPADLVRIKRGPNQKFAGLEDEEEATVGSAEARSAVGAETSVEEGGA